MAWDLVRKAKGRDLQPASLVFHYSQLQGGQYAALKPYIGQQGILQVTKLTFKYAKTHEDRLLVIAQTQSGEPLAQEYAERLLFIPAEVAKQPIPMNTAALEPLLAQAIEEHERQTEAQLETYFEQENEKLERWADDRRQALFVTVGELDAEIKALKKAARSLASTAEKVQAKKELRKLERKRDDALDEYHQARKQIEQEEDVLLEDVSAKLELTTDVQTLFSIHWTLSE